MYRKLSSFDFRAGLPLIVLGLGTLWFGRGYRVGTLNEMGPGFVPLMIAMLLIALGLLIGWRGRSEAQERMSTRSVRALICVLGSMVAFAALIETAGLSIAAFAATVLAAMATAEYRKTEVIAIGFGFAASAVGIFVYGLGQPIPIWWVR